jgi:hypothetical protein
LIHRIFTLSQTEFSSPTVAKEADPLFQLGQAFPGCDQLPTWSTFVNKIGSFEFLFRPMRTNLMQFLLMRKRAAACQS